MKSIKFILFLLICIVLSQTLISANELSGTKIISKPHSISFVQKQAGNVGGISLNDVTPYALSRRSRNALGAGITGSVFTGLGAAEILTGMVLILYANIGGDNYRYTVFGTGFVSGGLTATELQIVGFAVMGVGGLFCLIGIPLMIAGFVSFKIFRNKKVSLFMDSDKPDSARFGLVYKF